MASNGCSGGVSFLWKVFTGGPPEFEYCCDEHDLFYEQGGSAADRLFADKLFFECMKKDLRQRGKHPHAAWIFYYTIRMFGWIYWLT